MSHPGTLSYRIILSLVAYPPAVGADWEVQLTATAKHLESMVLYMTSLGKDRNSKFEVSIEICNAVTPSKVEKS